MFSVEEKKSISEEGHSEVKRSFEFFSRFDPFLIFFVTYFIYLLCTFPTVQTEDSGELITSAATLDIAHPPGYPLYVLVGKLFSIIIPFGNIAWRINIMSGFFGAAAVALTYLLLKKMIKNDVLAMVFSFFLAFSDIFWSQSIRAEVYSLNSFLLALIVYLLYRWHESASLPGKVEWKDEKESLAGTYTTAVTSSSAAKNKWLYWAAFIYGLSLGDHHMMFLVGPAIIIFVLVRKWRVLLEPKTIFISILLFLVGLSVYAYLPLKTCFSTYDNPAFIDHSGLCTWDKFSAFVNRKIYGGTVHLDTPGATQEATQEHLPTLLVDIKDFIVHYWTLFISSNQNSFLPLVKMILIEYFYLPLFFFLPGVYALFKKNWRWGLFIVLLFFSTSAILTMFSSYSWEVGNNFGARPFLMPVLAMLAIIMAVGADFLIGMIRKRPALVVTALFFFFPCFALASNFKDNNESKNYIAYDFNKNLLESIPPHGYLLSTGRDNMTFPLYYLRKVEGIRQDVNLEIYYSSAPVSADFLQEKLATFNAPVFIDLAPANYETIGLKPFGFAFALGDTSTLAYAPPLDMPLRGIRSNMDYNNNRLIGYYYAKMGLMFENDPQQRRAYFEKIIHMIPPNYNALNFIGDYDRNHGDFDQAEEAYKITGNTGGLQDVDNRRNEPEKAKVKGYQTPMY